MTRPLVPSGPNRLQHYPASLPAPGLVVRLAGTSQCHLVVRELAAFRHWGRLGFRIGLYFRGRLRDWGRFDWLNARDWRDHDVVL